MRNVINLNQNWKFIQEDVGLPKALPLYWQKVDLPHTWNAIDGHDGNGSYFRGQCWYAKTFETPSQPFGGQRVYVEIPAAGQQAAVYVNGTKVIYHEGGYSTFRADITDLCKDNGDNLLVIACSNEEKSNVYPQTADFTFYGGLYRGVNLISVPETHFDLDYYGAPGLKVTPKPCDCGGAIFELETWVTKAGVRSFYCDPQKGFFLNGVLTPLRGVSRHQDMLYKGNALTKEDHYEDARMIKELGANTIRLAHYQHSQEFYDACDEMGFIVWAEIPFISVMSKDPAAHDNCISQMKELIAQSYNHPSICFWGISNEILIGGISEQLIENHKELNALCKEMDPTRLTTIAHVTMTPVECPLHHITDVISYNHYFDWYGGKIEDNGPWFDHFHELHPDISVGVSEYGCEGIITYHGPNPQCKDYSEEYQSLYHEHLAKVLDERPWIWSSHVWNMFDFGCAARDEGGVAGRNNKGLVTMDRKVKKDSYYIYQAYWSKKPMIHLCGKRYAQRAGDTTEIKVYSNQPSVTLYQNGKLLETKQADDKVFVFTVSLAEGFNTFVAEAGDLKDSMTLEKVEKEPSIYVLPEVNERAEGVANWFKLSGDLDLEAPMEFPEGKYSIKDTIEEIAKSPEAFEIAQEVGKILMNVKLEVGVGMYEMARTMNLEKVAEMAGSRVLDGFMESVNAKLIKIDKVQ